MIQTQENGKKRHLDPNFDQQNFFTKLVDIVPSYHSMQFKRKLMNQFVSH